MSANPSLIGVPGLSFSLKCIALQFLGKEGIVIAVSHEGVKKRLKFT